MVPTFVRRFGTALLGGLAVAAFAQNPETRAKAGLASRLNVPAAEVHVLRSEPRTWHDSALGLPRLNEAAAQMVTPGSLIVLEARRVPFFYTAGRSAVRFGGPVALAGQSILFLTSPAGDPNLNSDLVQVSMVGTNPSVLIPSVSRFGIQPTGSVLAVRRTSRSGHELIYRAPGLVSGPVVLDGAFDFGPFASNETTWAACVRQTLANTWQIVVAPLNSDSLSREFPMPDEARPSRLLWHGTKLFARLATRQYSLDTAKPGARWEPDPYMVPREEAFLMLNKSESLDVKTVGPDAVILRVWFTGEEKEVARIPGFAFHTVNLVLGQWAFVTGDKAGVPTAYLVELSSGLVVQCLSGPFSEIHPYGQESGARAILTQAEKRIRP